ncbi:nicotinate-nucleotide--dimethylbenzimidazole phosphoribosyltransferase [Streptomyces sp. NPDC056244]|uniref:nicotinate-nucleotide--dimethylbenzimidazole phosphoribosyltransferase n=1 Tax=Streptomyces sp. NPDC056244 TaxID=3345762 RepID=UPI0035DD4D8D
MTDTGRVLGEGLPEDAGMVEQPGVHAPGAYTYLGPSESVTEDEDLLLMPSAQGGWGDPQVVPAEAPAPAVYAAPDGYAMPAPGGYGFAVPETYGAHGAPEGYGAAEQVLVQQQAPPIEQPGAVAAPVAQAQVQVPGSGLGPEQGPVQVEAQVQQVQAQGAVRVEAQVPVQQVPVTDPRLQVQVQAPVQAEPRQEFQAQAEAEFMAREPQGPVAVAGSGAGAGAGADGSGEFAMPVQVQEAPAGTPAEPEAVAAQGPEQSAPQPQESPEAPNVNVPEQAAPQGPTQGSLGRGQKLHQPGAHEAGGRDSGSVDLSGVRVPPPVSTAPPVPPQAPPRRPLHMGPPVPDPTGGVVRSLADRGPAGTPTQSVRVRAQTQGPPTTGPEYLDIPREEPEPAVLPGPQLGEIPPQAGAPWTTEPPVTPEAHAETVVPEPAPEQESAVQAEPVVQAGTAPQAEAVTEAQPVPEAQSAPEEQTVPEPEPVAVSVPEAQPAEAVAAVPEPELQPEAAPVVVPPAADEPVAVAAAVAESAPEPAAEPEPVQEAIPVPVQEVEPAPEVAPVTEPEPVPVAAAPVPVQVPIAEAEFQAEATPEPQLQPETAEEPAPEPEAVVPQGPPAASGFDDAEREAVLRVMRERRDIRNGFRSDPIPHEVLLRVLEAAHTAPSVGHSQPWDFVVIRSAETRRSMHELAQRQREAYAKSLPKGRAKQFKELKIEAILETPVNIVVTADPTRGGRHTLGRHTQPQMAPYSSALAVENLWLAARAEGLGVGWVSFFDEREMVRALGLPEHLEVVSYLCVGYVDEFPEEPELMRAGWSKRRPLSWVVHEETYGRRALPGEEPHDLLQETIAGIRPLDAKALGEAWERQKRMTKPAGALGMLEIISAQLSGLSRLCPPPIPEPAAVAIFAGDHGVHAQGVTPWPQEVTGQMVANFLGGGAVCNAFATQVGAEVCVIDVGVAGELPATPGLLPRKVRAGTGDFTTGPALSREEVLAAIEVGIETARDLVAAGNKALLTGEMGIANTTVSAALICVYTGQDASEVTGRGTGINDETHARKIDVVRRGLDLHQPDPADPIGVLAAVGGLEHAAMVGFLLGGASLRTPVILDGVSAGAAALVARAIAPEALAACIAGHRSAEPGHVAALNKLGLRPLVDLDLRLGEGTGALLALPVVQSAARVMHEVATFDSAGVTEK